MIQYDLNDYQLELDLNDKRFQINLNHKYYCVGQARGEIDPPHEVHLEHIEIFDQCRYIDSIVGTVLRRLPKIPAPNYRGKGLASLLLLAVIELGYERRVRRIWGAVQGLDGLDDEALLTWFQRYGFHPSPPDVRGPEPAGIRLQFDF